MWPSAYALKSYTLSILDPCDRFETMRAMLGTRRPPATPSPAPMFGSGLFRLGGATDLGESILSGCGDDGVKGDEERVGVGLRSACGTGERRFVVVLGDSGLLLLRVGEPSDRVEKWDLWTGPALLLLLLLLLCNAPDR